MEVRMKLGYLLGGVVLTAAFLSSSCEKKEEKAEAPPKQEVKEVQKAPEKKQVSEEYALADKKGCFACHDIRTKKVGPAYVEVAKEYVGKENAVEELVKSITKGSMGKWGSIPMTPQPVTEEEARKLAEWILSLK